MKDAGGAIRTIRLALWQPLGLFALSDIRIDRSQIVIVPHVPFGYHFTIHDASQGSSNGLIHARLEPQQGMAVSYPGGDQVSDPRSVLLPERVIPAFKDIRGIISVFGAAKPVAVSVAALAAQARAVRRSELRAKVITLRPVRDIIGWNLLLVEPGNSAALRDWTGAATQVTLLSEGLPWLALATFQAKIEDEPSAS